MNISPKFDVPIVFEINEKFKSFKIKVLSKCNKNNITKVNNKNLSIGFKFSLSSIIPIRKIKNKEIKKILKEKISTKKTS